MGTRRDRVDVDMDKQEEMAGAVRILDLFCGAGGAAMGMRQALQAAHIAHEIVGVKLSVHVPASRRDGTDDGTGNGTCGHGPEGG